VAAAELAALLIELAWEMRELVRPEISAARELPAVLASLAKLLTAEETPAATEEARDATSEPAEAATDEATELTADVRDAICEEAPAVADEMSPRNEDASELIWALAMPATRRVATMEKRILMD